MTTIATIILAAGQGTRMKSNLPKVLHPIAGKAMLDYVLDASDALQATSQTVVVSPANQDIIGSYLEGREVEIAVQKETLGTAHAVQAALPFPKQPDAVLVLYGDTPFIAPETLQEMIKGLQEHAVMVLGFEPEDAAQYGRLLLGKEGHLEAILEYKDANEAERAIPLCNSGVIALRGAEIEPLLNKVDNQNAKQEYYLTDVVQIAREAGHSCGVIRTQPERVMGINSRKELARAEAMKQQQLREHWMDKGVTMIAPETVFLCDDTQLGTDVTIHPNVVIGNGCVIDSGCEIKAFSHIEQAHIGKDCAIGPFARLRPGSALEAQVHIGNFVEVKNSKLAKGVKAGHLSYLGDSDIGENTNIGAGTITCNYDGIHKSRTIIGEGTFIGSNTSLVAPVNIGAGAIIGAGSTVTKDVPDNALMKNSMKQEHTPNGALDYKQKKR